MKLLEFHEPELKEPRIELYYNKKDQEVLEVLNFLDGCSELIGKEGTDTIVISPQDIYYFEAVDKKCFAYLKQKVYQVAYTLQELEEKLLQMGFARINKSMIVNLHKVDRLTAGLNMRMTAVLQNEEQLVINRSYKNKVNEAIQKLYRGLEHENN